MDERLKKQLDFALEVDKEKNIFRQTHLSGHGRNENDAEHAWHMALMAYLLKEYSNEPVDIAKVMLMCMIHDVVEIDAGDTYAYDAEGLKTQKEREDKAKERIFSLLPDDQKAELIALLMSLKHMKHLSQSMLMPWIIFSHCFSTTAMEARIGRSMALLLIRSMVGRARQDLVLRSCTRKLLIS